MGVLRERREHQVDNRWVQVCAGAAVVALSGPRPLSTTFPDGKWHRQMTRWPEDWRPGDWHSGLWVDAVVQGARTQVRVEDIE